MDEDFEEILQEMDAGKGTRASVLACLKKVSDSDRKFAEYILSRLPKSVPKVLKTCVADMSKKEMEEVVQYLSRKNPTFQSFGCIQNLMHPGGRMSKVEGYKTWNTKSSSSKKSRKRLFVQALAAEDLQQACAGIISQMQSQDLSVESWVAQELRRKKSWRSKRKRRMK